MSAPNSHTHSNERAMIKRVKEDRTVPTLGDRLHICQLAERFLDRLDMDAERPSETATTRAEVLEEVKKSCENLTPANPLAGVAWEAYKEARKDFQAVLRALKNAAPQENKAGAPSGERFIGSDLSGRALPNEPAVAASPNCKVCGEANPDQIDYGLCTFPKCPWKIATTPNTHVMVLRETLEEINRDAWSDDKTRLRVIARATDKLLQSPQRNAP